MNKRALCLQRCSNKYCLRPRCQGATTKAFLSWPAFYPCKRWSWSPKTKMRQTLLSLGFICQWMWKKKCKRSKINVFTSTDVQFDVISFVVDNKILWAGFFGSVVEFADTLRLNEVKALAQGLFPAYEQAFCITRSSIKLFISMSL